MEILDGVIRVQSIPFVVWIQISVTDVSGKLEGAKPILWIFYTAGGKRTFPKAQQDVTVKPQEESGPGIYSLE